MTQLKRIFHTTALAAFAAMLAGLLSGEARAGQESSWTLESRSGQVNLVKTGMVPISLSTGDVFADGDWIETGPDGRAMLKRGEETIVVAPNSRIGLPKSNDGPYATRILQTLGTILLTVEKKAAQHFEIETPYLTAVVKGTTFTVGIQDGRAVVHVVEGLVEVNNLSSGRSSLIRPGQTGSVIRGGSGNIEIDVGGANGTPASAAATQAPGASQATAPVASQASPVAVAAVSNGKSRKVRIARALGPTTLDLSKSTKGLVRAAQGGQGKALGKGHLAGKQATASDVRSNGLALGKTAAASGARGSAGNNGLALGKTAAASRDLSSAGNNGLALGKTAAASRALRSAGNNGLAHGNSAIAKLQASVDHGHGAGDNPRANPVKGHGNGNSN